MSSPSLNGPALAPASGVVKRLVIFLHGYGADGNDLLSLAEMMELPDTQFISPHAPFPCEMSPFGRQWFSLADRAPGPMLAGAMTAAPILNAFIDAQMARYSLQANQVALIGFSQGSMMAMYAALRRPDTVAGIVAYSGALIGGDLLGGEATAKPPICLIHGTADEVVPFVAMQAAERQLTAAGIRIEAYARPRLGHGIDPEGIEFASAFLKKVFGV